MESDKDLNLRMTKNNYKNESGFEYISIYLPMTYNNENILDYIIQLNVNNKDDVGDVVTLVNPTIYKNRYKYEFAIPLKWTAVPGKITLWLKFIKDGNVIGFTNQVSGTIFDTQEITDYIPEQSLSLLDEWTLKMEAIQQETKDYVTHPPILGENGNWYIYKDNKYIDSGISPKLGFSTSIQNDYWLMFHKEN